MVSNEFLAVPRALVEVFANSSERSLSEINDAIQKSRALLDSSESGALQKQLDALELSRRSWMDEAKSLEAKLARQACVVIPRRVSPPAVHEYREGWNDCVDKIMDLNADAEIRIDGEECKRESMASCLESLAKQIYQSWESQPGFHPWVEGGNSAKQEEARQIASRTFELALANQVDPAQ